MYIRRFEVKNFMVHRSTQIDLYPITVFVGANNGGKSAFFDAILNFSMVSRGRLSTAFGPGPYSYQFLKYHGASKAARIGYKVILSASATSEANLTYEISYGQTGDSYIIFDEVIRSSSGEILFDRRDADSYPMGTSLRHLSSDRSIFAAVRQAQLDGGYEESDPLVTMVARDVSKISKYRLDPSELSRPSKLPDTPVEDKDRALSPRLSYRGDDLSTVLYFLSETQSPSYDKIITRCRETIDGFDGFEFNTVGTDRIGYSVIFADSRGSIPAANLSDGTLTCLGLITLLLGPERPPILCIEEPENGLTPPVTRAIYKTMRDFVSEDVDGQPGQLLISSHSPYVVCEAWNGIDRDFIYQMSPVEGASVVRKFGEILDHHKIQLEKDNDGNRTLLNLRNAELVIEGYLSS